MLQILIAVGSSKFCNEIKKKILKLLVRIPVATILYSDCVKKCLNVISYS